MSYSSNRTLLELKFEKSRRGSRIASCSNRTLLELKWNNFLFENRSKRFQSYLTGIEIKKINNESCKFSCVPIVPYWN